MKKLLRIAALAAVLALVSLGAAADQAQNVVSDGTTWQGWRQAGTGANAALGAGRVASEGGHSSALNVAAATNIKAAAGRLYKVIVVVTAATASNVCDSTVACAAGTNLLVIPASTTAGTVYDVNWPMNTGIRLEPGAGVTLAASFD
jgi:hypothetical protein